MFRKSSHGQVSSIDLMVASILFILIFISIRGIWVSNTQAAQESFFFSEMQLKSEAALDSLVKTQGYPEQWSASNVELIGLADKPLVLSETKVKNFVLMDYNKALSLLALGNYDFNFSIVSSNPSDSVSFGRSVSANTFSVGLKRVVNYKGVEASVFIKVFSK